MHDDCRITVLGIKCFPDFNDVRIMIDCCNDGTRPLIFKIGRIDIPETTEEPENLPAAVIDKSFNSLNGDRIESQ